MAKFRVNSLTGRPFRRNGITFGGVPIVVDSDAPPDGGAPWTEAQIANLKSAAAGGIKAGAALHVEEISGAGGKASGDLKPPEPGTPEEALVAAAVDGADAPSESHHRGRGRNR
jgi:hypothetical protein